MSEIISVADVKAQLNQTLGIDDALIQKKITAAIDHIERMIGFKLDEETFPDTDDDDFPATVPAALKEAVCQLAAWWYEQRGAAIVGVNAQEIPHGVWELIGEYRETWF